jgi:hypothetical protein
VDNNHEYLRKIKEIRGTHDCYPQELQVVLAR